MRSVAIRTDRILLFFLILAFKQLQANAYTISSDTNAFSVTDTAIVLLAAHRGGYDCALPENSISLFNYTANKSCTLPVVLELDIRKSKNGSLYLMHDSTINRTTTGIGKITELEDSYLETLFLLDRHGKVTSEKIPSFDDILVHFQHLDVILMLDGKEHVYKEVVEMVKNRKMEEKCIFLTFNKTDTETVCQSGIESSISVLAGNESEWKTNLEIVQSKANAIAYINQNTTDKVKDEIKKAGFRIMTDVNEVTRNSGKPFSREYYVALFSGYNPDIIITDFPVYVSDFFCR